MNEFKFDNIKIENKKYLIEASAGTGKTHSMGQIFIRLVIEGFSSEKMLLVTFTNAAAEEIKERLLIFLTEVKNYLLHNDTKKDRLKINRIKNDKDLLDYLDNIINKNKNIDKIINCLDNSIFNFDKILVSTIHSFAINLVKEFSNELGLPYNYMFSKDNDEISKIALQKYFLKNHKIIESFSTKKPENKNKSEEKELSKIVKEFIKIKRFYENYKIDLQNDVEDIQNKQENITNINELKGTFLKFYAENSLKIKKKYGVFDFNDSIELLLNLLKNNEEIRKKVSERFDVLIVDEFQDTDEIQVNLFETLFSDKIVFYIGDPKQSIYGFRGGDFINYLNIKKKIDDKNKFLLKTSFRSTPEVLSFINEFSIYYFNIKNTNASTDDQEDKSGKVDKSGKNDLVISPKIKELLKYEDVISKVKSHDKSEAKLIILKKAEDKALDYLEKKKLASLIKDKIEELKKDDPEFKYEKVAILLKNKLEINLFYKFFTEFGLPCALKIDKSVFDTDEAIFIYYLLNAICNKDSFKFIKLLLLTPYFDYTFDTVNSEIEDKHPEIAKILDKLYNDWQMYGIYSIFENLFLNSSIKFERFSGFNFYDYERKLTNIRQIFEILTKLFQDSNLTIFNQIERVKGLIKGDEDEEDLDDFNSMRIESEENAILISTIHSSKGLEYDTVFCPIIDFSSRKHPRYPSIYYDYENDSFTKKYVLDSGSNKKEEKDKKNRYYEYLDIQDDNLRYVAITRAKNSLYIFFPELSEKDDNKSNQDKYKKGPNKKKNNDLSNLKEIACKIGCLEEIDIDEINLSSENYDNIKNIDSENEKQIKSKGSELKAEDLKEIEDLNLESFNNKIEKIYSYSSISHTKNRSEETKNQQKDFQDIVIGFKPDKEEREFDFEEKYSDFKGRFAGNIFHETMAKLVLEYYYLFENPSGKDDKIEKLSEQIIKRYYKSEKIIQNFAKENKDLIFNTLKTEIPFFNKRIYQLKNLYPEVEFLAKAKEKNIKELYKIFKKDDESSLSFSQDIIIKGYFKGFIDLIFIEDNKINFIDWKTNDLSAHLSEEEKVKNNATKSIVLKDDILKKEIIKSNYDIQYNLYATVLYSFIKSNNLPYEFGNVYYFFVRYLNENNNSGVFVKQFDKNEIEELASSIIERG